VTTDSEGNLYGTTARGGNGYGVVFEVNKAGVETVLYNFTGGADGAYPIAGLVRDAAGNLYGTTANGGNTKCSAPSGCGVIFKVDSTGKETVLHTFSGHKDGAIPGYGSLIMDAKGNFYGTTTQGGDADCNAPDGCGVIFELDAAGKESVLYSFTGGMDGAVPEAGVVEDVHGNLYGTTFQGGNPDCGMYGCGVVFKFTP
jgi:uncharacterized repeat protein (TIGR03803 family)